MQVAVSSLIGLIVINTVAMSATLAGMEESPPASAVPAMGAIIALGFVFLPLLWWRNKAGYIGAIVVGILGIIIIIPAIGGLVTGGASTIIVPAILVMLVLSLVVIGTSAAASREKT